MIITQQKKFFTDRCEAGIRLGKSLTPLYKDRNAVVLGIPPGGATVAFYLAGVLNAEMSTIVASSLLYPGKQELIGAISEDGSLYFTARGLEMDGNKIEQIVSTQFREIRRDVAVYRKGKPLPDLKGRVVILVDDSIESGATLVPAIKLCRERGAAEIVIASPASTSGYVSDIGYLADHVKILVRSKDDFIVKEHVYEYSRGVEQADVIHLLEEQGTQPQRALI